MLSAAERIFAERGLDATLEEIAAAAGVGVGTVYRRFASKDALLKAVFDRRLEAGTDLLAACAAHESAWEGLCTLLRRSLSVHVDDRGLHEFLYVHRTHRDRHGDPAGPQPPQLRERVEPPLTALINRAKAEGALRDDFAATDIPPLILMLSRLAHTDPTLGPTLARRYLELLLQGLRPGADPTPVPPPPDNDALARWFTALGR